MGNYEESLEQDTLEATYAALEPVVPESPMIYEVGYENAIRLHEVSGLIDETPSYDTLVGGSNRWGLIEVAPNDWEA